MTPPSLRASRAAWIVLVAIITVIVYLPALHSGFQFDDFQAILNNPALQAASSATRNWLAIALSSDTGMLRRPLSMLSFGANIALFGMSPFAFKAVNLAIHLLNGLLLFLIARRILAQWLDGGDGEHVATGAALFIASIWLLHPLNVSSVAYVVQRMNELSTLFMLAGLYCYVEARRPGSEMNPGQGLLGLSLFALLAIFSKENGALIFAYAFLIEYFAFGFKGTQNQRRTLQVLFGFVLALPLTLIALYLIAHPGWLAGGYAMRDFSLFERLLTEARILWLYVLWIFVPNPAWMGLFHDDIALSTSPLLPPTTLMAIIAWIVVAGSAVILRKRQPAYSFAVAWFLVGHSMESTVIALELVFEHRNYLPMAGLLIGVTAVVVKRFHRSDRSRRKLTIAATASVAVFAVFTAARAQDWSDPLRLAMADVRHHPASARSQYEAGRAIVIDGAIHGAREAADSRALPYFQRATQLDVHSIHGLVAAILIDARHGPVAAADLHELAQRLRVIRPYNKANPFLDLLSAAGTEKLSLDGKDLSALVDAAMDNQNLPAKVRARVLNNYGAWQFNVAHDAQAAVSLTSAAAALQPTDAYYPLNLAQIASLLGQRDKALEYLAQARKLDATGAYAGQVSDLLHQLDATQH